MAQQSAETGRLTFNCLIADDSAFARKNISNVVTRLGGVVVGEATNGNEAVELYFKLRPDLMLLDITMPLQDGVDTLRKIVAGDKEARVIMVSSIGHKEMIWRALCLGAKHFITKPYNAEYAGSIIKSILEGKKEEPPCASNT